MDKPSKDASTQPSTPTPDPYGNKAPKQPIGLIIAAILAGVIILGIAAQALFMNNDTSDDPKDNRSSSERKQDDDDAKKRAANSKTAARIGDFGTVCETGSISNAAEYKAPYKVAAFSKTSDKRSWSQVTLKYDADYTVKHDEFSDVNTVVCAKEDEDSTVKTKECEFNRNTLDYYATVYEVSIHNAQTGEKIKDLGTVSGPADSCPMFVTYDRNDPKIIAKPDQAGIDAKIAEFISEQ